MDDVLVSPPSWNKMITSLWFNEVSTQLTLFIKDFMGRTSNKNPEKPLISYILSNYVNPPK